MIVKVSLSFPHFRDSTVPFEFPPCSLKKTPARQIRSDLEYESDCTHEAKEQLSLQAERLISEACISLILRVAVGFRKKNFERVIFLLDLIRG